MSNEAKEADSPEMTGEMRRYFEPLLPAPASAPLSRNLRTAMSSEAKAADSPGMTEEKRRYFEPLLPAPASAPLSRNRRTGSGADVVRRKATVSTPGDVFEREADEVADKVMRMAEPPAIGSAPITIQRKCTACTDEKQQTILNKHAASVQDGAELDTEAAIRAAKRSGEPLPSALRSYFEPRFGQEFSQVRVHADAGAADAARAVQARAYTVDDHIVFGAGEYAPATPEGRRIIAHELVHVLQQRRGVDRKPDGIAGAPSAEAPHANTMQGSGAHADPHGTHVTSAGPQLQRTSLKGAGGSLERMFAVVGSVQFCVDFCSGHAKLTGWLWGGAGAYHKKSHIFFGPSAFVEHELWGGHIEGLDFIDCGECSPDCSQGALDPFAAGPALFKELMGGDKEERKKKKLAGLECGIVVVPESLCRVSLEFICFLNLLSKVPQLAPIVEAIEKTGGEAKAGIDGSFTVKLCKNAAGNWVVPKLEACIGGYVEMGFGAPDPKDPNGVPGKPQTPSPSPPPAHTPAPASKPPPAANPPPTAPPTPAPTPSPSPHFDPNLPIS